MNLVLVDFAMTVGMITTVDSIAIADMVTIVAPIVEDVVETTGKVAVNLTSIPKEILLETVDLKAMV